MRLAKTVAAVLARNKSVCLGSTWQPQACKGSDYEVRRAQIFNILCEQPETVAAFLVPRVRTVAARREAGRYIRYLTLARALERFLTAPMHANRFFDSEGAPAMSGHC